MESKINYHALTMDEIVFDNRNKNYGAFVVRQACEKNQLKAILICIGLFVTFISAPAILKYFGLLAEHPVIVSIEQVLDFDKEKYEVIKKETKAANPKIAPPKAKVTTPIDNEYEAVKPNEAEVLEKKPSENTNENPTGNSNPSGPGNLNGTASTGTSNNQTQEKKKYLTPVKWVEEMPSFIGGREAFDNFVEINLIHPDPELEGTTEIQFVVNEDGSIDQIVILHSSGSDVLDKAALNLIKKLPHYNPGRQNGMAVKVLCVIPITFETEQ